MTDVAVPSGRDSAVVREASGSRTAFGDRSAIAVALSIAVAMLILTWGRWGMPQIDAGSELASAERLADGALPYRDYRYFYGPGGLSVLALAFKAFGPGFGTAFAFGIAQYLAILAVFYALARTWVRPATACVLTVALAAIGLLGWASLVVPNTTSATFGLLMLLASLLALARGRLALAGVLVGLTTLSRLEFAVAGAAVVAGYAVGIAYVDGVRKAPATLLRLVAPAVAIPLVVYGVLAAAAGPSRLLTENLLPLDFLRVSSLAFQRQYTPLNLEAPLTIIAVGVAYAAFLIAAMVTAERLARPTRGRRLVALWPIAAVGTAVLISYAAVRVLGVFPGARTRLQNQMLDLSIGMSWLPAVGLAALIWAALCVRRRAAPPLGASWPLDLALILGSTTLILRSYGAFDPTSYAPYFAAPLLIIGGALHERLAVRSSVALRASLGVLTVVAASLVVGAVATGPTSEKTVGVRTPRGTIRIQPAIAANLQQTIDFLGRRSSRGEPMLVVPSDAGIGFMTAHPPALYDSQFLPGSLDSERDERAAISELERRRVRIVVVGNGRFEAWGKPEFGVDYNRRLQQYIATRFRRVAEFGDVDRGADGQLSDAFAIYERS